MRHFERFASLAIAALVLVISLPRLSSFGIWDPAELEAADTARKLIEGKAVGAVASGPRLASYGFSLLGVDEWTGRLPLALAGIAAALAAYGLCRFVSDRRAALYAAMVAASSPLFVLNARLMLGATPSFALQGAIALCGLIAMSERVTQKQRGGALLAALTAAVISVRVDGALQGALPPLLALAAAALFDGRLRKRPIEGGALLLVALSLVGLVAHAMWIDPAEHSVWLGGGAQGGQPPAYDIALERIIHAFAPWSALLPLALARFVLAQPEATELDEKASDARFAGTLLVAWIALGYAAQTLFLSRYGKEAAFLPLVALACAVGLFLRDFERLPGGHWPIAVTAMLLAMLLVRDYALYPIAPVHALGLADFKAPEGFNPRAAWGLVLGLFAGVSLLAFGAPPQDQLALREPYAFLKQSWRRSIGHKVWWLLLALALASLLAFGALAWVPGAAKLSTQARKVGKALGFVPFLVPMGIAGLQLAVFLFGRLGTKRPWAVLVAGAIAGLYTAHGFMPKLSAHFSPRDVYETYNTLAHDGEPLIEYRVGSRAAAYYAQGSVEEVDSLTALLRKLEASERVWAVIPSDELASIDRMFRRKAKRHLFGADMRSGRVMLVANQKIGGRQDENPLAKAVTNSEPKPQFPAHAIFEGKIELLGYDLDLPNRDHVGAGEKFDITWYFRVLRAVPGDYKVFVHMDGEGQRIHGDHVPVNETYPVRYWDEGDVIVDRQTLDVPATFRPSELAIFMGFFSGETRMEVTEGAEDDANRARVGVLRIR